MAEFTVVDYLDYSKPGKYGDERQKAYHQRLSDASPHVRELVAGLAPGTAVRLSWEHDYVTRTSKGGTSQSPERHITALEVA